MVFVAASLQYVVARLNFKGQLPAIAQRKKEDRVSSLRKFRGVGESYKKVRTSPTVVIFSPFVILLACGDI
jgi:hypothetical protein